MKILILHGESHRSHADAISDVLEEEWGNVVHLKTDNVNEYGYILADYDFVISYYYPYILSDAVLEYPRYGIINCHASLLPFNRGVHTNVWPIVECTPAGVSIHKMVSGLDMGNILVQKEIEVTDYHTGYNLYEELKQEMYRLLINYWPTLQSHLLKYKSLPEGIKQDGELATFHRISDLKDIQDLSSYFTMSEMTTIREFVDIVRACTFDGYDGAYITNEDEERVYYKLTPYKVDE